MHHKISEVRPSQKVFINQDFLDILTELRILTVETDHWQLKFSFYKSLNYVPSTGNV